MVVATFAIVPLGRSTGGTEIVGTLRPPPIGLAVAMLVGGDPVHTRDPRTTSRRPTNVRRRHEHQPSNCWCDGWSVLA